MASKVLYIIHSYPVGTQTFVQREYEALRSSGVHVDVYPLHAPRLGYLLRDKQGARTVTPVISRATLGFVIRLLLQVFRLPCLYLDWRSFSRFPVVVVHAALLGWRLRSAPMCKRGEIIVHAHFAARTLDVGHLLKRVFPEVTLSVTGHAGDITNPVNRRRLSQQLSEADVVIAASEYVGIAMAKLRGSPISGVVRCALPAERFAGSPALFSTNHTNRLLFVGRLVEKKGLRYLLEALESHPALRRADVTLTVVGDGPLRSSLELQCVERGLSRRVHFLGALPSEVVLSTMVSQPYIFVLPCVRSSTGDEDGLPVVLTEAMALRLPVVTTRVAGISELISNEVNGLLVEPGDMDALGDAIARLVDDSVLLRRLARAGYEHVKDNYDSAKEAGKLATLWDSKSNTREGAA